MLEKWIKFVTIGGCFVLLPVAGATIQKKDDKDALARKDTRVEPTSSGNVFGRVYDAETGAPIKDVSISLETDEGFLTKGRSFGKTDELGGYRAQAVLGRISHNFDVGRALLSSGLGLLFGTATNTTKRIDVSQVNVRMLLSQVVAGNPIHPRANLVLSQLLAADGDVAGAAEALAQHAKYYGEVRGR